MAGYACQWVRGTPTDHNGDTLRCPPIRRRRQAPPTIPLYPPAIVTARRHGDPASVISFDY